MIRLGFTESEKDSEITRYCKENQIRKVFILSHGTSQLPCSFAGHEHIEYSQVIQYKYYYRLLQEIDDSSLIVVNECLRTQNRNDLTYNCIRNYLNQTRHRIVFQYLPIIDTLDDFMILFDLDTRSRWKRDKWRESMRGEIDIVSKRIDVRLDRIYVETDNQTRVAYQREKKRIISGIGLRDPHTIPRNLHLISGKAKLRVVESSRQYVGRNNRFKIPSMHTFKDDSFPDICTIFEYCHNFISFEDFLAKSGQSNIPVLVTDLKVDEWYHERYVALSKRIRDAYTAIHG